MLEQGDPVHICWTGVDNTPPYAAAYIVIKTNPTATWIWSDISQCSFEVPTRTLVPAKPDEPAYVPGQRWAGVVQRLRDPSGWAQRVEAYKNSARRLTPKEIEDAKQAGLRPLYDKMDGISA